METIDPSLKGKSDGSSGRLCDWELHNSIVVHKSLRQDLEFSYVWIVSQRGERGLSVSPDLSRGKLRLQPIGHFTAIL